MNTFFISVWTWIKANLLLSAGIALVLVYILFHKSINKMIAPHRVRHRPGYHRSISAPVHRGVHNRSLPRSVGLNKNGTRKKPWQIAGSAAAKRHMAEIRKRR
jgi:hypothetical protein